MTQDSRPWQGIVTGDCGPYSSSQWQTTWAHMVGFGTEGNDVGVVRGVLNELNVIANTPNDNTVILQSGAALVQGIWYLNDANLALTIANNGTAFNRYDTVVLEADYTAQTVRAVIVQGTPAAVPLRPALTQTAATTWQIPIADVLVAPGTPPTIAITDISQRQHWANIPDRVEIEVINNTGLVREAGYVVAWDNTANSYVKTPAVATNDTNIAGVLESYVAIGGTTRIVTQGLCVVRTTGVVARSSFLVNGSDKAQADSTGTRIGVFGIALTTAVNNYCLAYINVVWPSPIRLNSSTDSVNNVSTTAAFPQTITGLSIAFTKQEAGTALRFTMSGYATLNNAATATFQIWDSTAGAQRGNLETFSTTAAGGSSPICIATGRITGIAAGARTVIGRFGVTGGFTLTAFDMYLYIDEEW